MGCCCCPAHWWEVSAASSFDARSTVSLERETTSTALCFRPSVGISCLVLMWFLLVLLRILLELESQRKRSNALPVTVGLPNMGSGVVMHHDSCVCLCVYLTSFLTFFLTSFLPYALILTYLLHYWFTSELSINLFQNRPVSFPGRRS